LTGSIYAHTVTLRMSLLLHACLQQLHEFELIFHVFVTWH